MLGCLRCSGYSGSLVSPVRPPTLAYAAPAGLVGEAYRSLLRLLTPGGGKKDDDLPYADPPVTPR